MNLLGFTVVCPGSLLVVQAEKVYPFIIKILYCIVTILGIIFGLAVIERNYKPIQKQEKTNTILITDYVVVSVSFNDGLIQLVGSLKTNITNGHRCWSLL